MDIETLNVYGAELREKLSLSSYPVAIKLVRDEKDIPAGMEKPESMKRHCQFVDTVRRTGKSYAASEGDQQCKGGAAALGLGTLSEKVRSGRFYFEDLGHFRTLESAKKTIDAIPFRESGSTKAVLYAPLEKASFMPDVVMFICLPKQAMILTQSSLYANGGRLDALFSGKQSVCSDGVAQVLAAGKPNVTIGCSGSRSYAEITDDEMIFSLPADQLEDLMAGLRVFVK